MVARIDWLNDGIDRMLAGKSPVTPEQWKGPESIIERDVELLQLAAGLNSLRPGASQPDLGFVRRLRERIADET